jgi:Helix-hairpin-helix domain
MGQLLEFDMDNSAVAKKLLDYAQYLEARGANVFRVRAYRRAAETVMGLDQPLCDLLEAEGRAGLEELPGIGPRLASVLEELLRTGELRTFSADGAVEATDVLSSLPGVSRRLARVIHEQLQVNTLEELEQAAHEGRLGQVGIGPKRLRGIRDALAGRLGRYRFPRPLRGEPPVADILAVDEAYAVRVQAAQLPLLSPRRFNPGGESWLPFFHTRRNGWRYRALYSNTALAHRLKQTHDWVVVYFDDGLTSGQRTVVTETRGPLAGHRVVRGRERECLAYYQEKAAVSN